MRQSYISKIDGCFDDLKKESKELVKGLKGSNFRGILAKEIQRGFKKLENENFEKWTRLNIAAIDTKYMAGVILRVEFIMLSLFRLSKKNNTKLTLSDYRYLLTSPLLPHNKIYSQECNLIESTLRMYFGKGWGHEAIILRDFNHYFIAKEALGSDMFLLDKVSGIEINHEFMNISLFDESSSIFWSKTSTSQINTIKKQLFSRVFLSNIPHSDIAINPSENLLSSWFPASKNESKSINLRFAAKDKSGYCYPVKDIFNSVIKEQYKKFKRDIDVKQSCLKVIRKTNSNIEIIVSDLIKFVSEEMNIKDPKKNWLNRLEAIRFYDVLLEKRSDIVTIQDVNHWIGLPNVGKTTVMNILAAYLVKKYNLKVGLVLRENSDVDAAVDTLIKCDIKAVPFIGFSYQEDHLKRRVNKVSSVDDISTDNVVPYYLNNCRLKAMLDLSSTDDLSKIDFCYNIGYYKKNIYTNDNAYIDTDNLTFKGNLSCPYIFECDKYSSRYDFSSTQVYLTNIQSFVQTITKKTIFKQQVPSFELLAKECDVIFVDEADNMLDTIDSFFVDEEYIVEGRERGLLELMLEEVERESHGKKAHHKNLTKWLRTARHCKSTAEVILHMITDGNIPKTILGKPFTSRSVINYWLCRVLKSNPDKALEDADGVIEGLEFEEAALNEKRIEMFNYYNSYINDFVLGYGNGESASAKDALINYMIQASTSVFYTTEGDFPTKTSECFELFLQKFEIVLKREGDTDIKNIERLKNLFRFAMTVTTFEVLYNYTQINVDSCRSFIKNEELIGKTAFIRQFYKHYEGILPLAAGGAKYGLSYEEENGEKSLKIKKYLNVGRYLLYDMPKIFSRLDLTDAARVVLLSATSYMPHSPNYHINIKPNYILENDDTSQLKLSYKKMFLRNSDGEIIKFSGCNPKDSKRILDDMAKDLCYIDYSNPEYMSKIDKIFDTTLYGRKRIAFTVGSFYEAIDFGHSLKKYLSEYALLTKYKFCIIDSSDSREGHEGLDVFVKSNLDRFEDTDYNIAIIVTKSLERGVNILTEQDYNKFVASFSTLVYIKRPYLVPNNLNDLVAILNSYSIDMYTKDYSDACAYLGGEYSISAYVKRINDEVRKFEAQFYNRTYYRFIDDENVRKSILANILVSTHQLEGRFYRGNVPATVIFADGSFFPKEADGDRQSESFKTSIIEGFIKYFDDFARDTSLEGIKMYQIIKKLYGFRIEALSNITYLY